MMQVMPMPCCGTHPPIPEHTVQCGSGNGVDIVETTDNSKFGWDLAGLCRSCRTHKSHFSCASQTCLNGVGRFDRFCSGCHGAFEMGVIEDPGPWSADPAATGLRYRAFPSGFYTLGAYVDGRWFVEHQGVTLDHGTATDELAAKVVAVGVWKQHLKANR